LRRFGKILAVVAILLLAGYLTRESWLVFFGTVLVNDEQPFNAQAIICLAGDPVGNRITKSAELVQKGYAPIVLVSGPGAMYGTNEALLAIDFAVARGFPGHYFKAVTHNANSTLEEAWAFRTYLEKEGIKKILVVTSDYHTARAGRTFREVLKETEMRIVAAPDRDFRAESWWKTRQAQKQVFFEWTKTLARILGI
jgi:uncharacterized SAM-binding protein YcdF (DUF218 family)